jgi:hypothetical protein
MPCRHEAHMRSKQGIRRSWAYLENDPVKIQCRQEEALHTENSLEMRTMHRLSPLMKLRPKTANERPASVRKGATHYRDTEEGYGHIGEDGSRGEIRKVPEP